MQEQEINLNTEVKKSKKNHWLTSNFVFLLKHETRHFFSWSYVFNIGRVFFFKY